MKNVLKRIEPERVLYYFEEMSNIVRGSSHEKPMSDYLYSFAKERGYQVWQDELFNIFIKVPGAAGGENAKPVVLHGHMDMVWNTAEGVEHDFFKEPLDLYIDGDYVKARGTTLGADNGIGVAYIMALIENQDIPHPPFECVITVMEEMGKKGLNVFDMSRITAKRMIDFNWIDDKQILVGCCGDESLRIAIPALKEDAPSGYAPLLVQLKNLKGGHCEWEIHAERANALIVMARLLEKLMNNYDVCLASYEGGVQNNVIPRYANAEILVAPKDKQAVLNMIKEETAVLKNEFAVADPDLEIAVADMPNAPGKIIGKNTAKKMIKMVHLMPNGMLNINLKVRKTTPFSEVVDSCGGFPTETDNNLGILRTEDNEIWMITTITSAVTSRKHDVADRITTLAELADIDAVVEQFGVDAPEFPYDEKSQMAKIAHEAYTESYGFAPQHEVNCCSLQLGMLVMKCGLDCVGIGTEISGCHSAAEQMSLPSVAKAWKMILNFMTKLTRE